MRSAVVTGIGLRTCLGPDTETTWRSLLSGGSGLEPFWAGAVGGAVGWARGFKAAPDESRTLALALAAAREALSTAALETREIACIAGLGKPELGPWGALDPAFALSAYLD